MRIIYWLLVSSLAGFPGGAILEADLLGSPCAYELQAGVRQQLLTEINELRRSHRSEPLQQHSTLSDLASWRAEKVAAGGSLSGSRGLVQEATQRLYRDGYQPHSWVQTVFVVQGSRRMFSVEEGKQAKKNWFKEVRDGDFLDAGIGIQEEGDRCIYSFVLALPKKTFEWRTVEYLQDLPAIRSRMLTEVNRVRLGKGRAALLGDSKLDRAAQRHAEDMLGRSYYAHRSPEGETAKRRARKAGYPRAKLVAENIAKGQFEPEEVVSRWMNSSGHRSNLLRRNVSAVGSGIAVGEDDDGIQVLWVQVFAGELDGQGR